MTLATEMSPSGDRKPTAPRLKWESGSFAILSCACAAVILLAVAFCLTWLASHDLRMPYDIDLFRDSAFAQSILQGRFPADAYYANEQNWYNPLGPAIVAVVARIFNAAPITIYSHYGAIVGLTVPLAIFGLAISLFGRWAGLASLFAFVYLAPPELPSWAAPSYSPWLFANLLSLLPFSAAVAAAVYARQSSRHWVWVGCGFLVGLTFLAHTATAIVAGCVTLALSWDRKKLGVVALRWSSIVLTAFLAGTPLLITILWHYGLRIRNEPPLEFMTGETDVHQLGHTLLAAINVRNVLALVGLGALFRNQSMRSARLALITALAVCGFLLFYGYARQAWPNARMPGLLPPFHWLFHLRLVRALLIGYALFSVAVAFTMLPGGFQKVPPAIALLALCAMILVFEIRPFSRRYDLVEARKSALETATWPGFRETIAWLRRETRPGTVILAPPLDAVLVLGAAGRPTVVIDRTFSNPYVPYEPRLAAAERMNQDLASHQRDRFLQAAAQYRVSYVLLTDVAPGSAPLAAPFATKVFSSGRYTVMRIIR